MSMRLERLQLFLVLTVGFISDLRLLPCKLRDVAMNTFFLNEVLQFRPAAIYLVVSGACLQFLV
jgi:hypothetical protein